MQFCPMLFWSSIAVFWFGSRIITVYFVFIVIVISIESPRPRTRPITTNYWLSNSLILITHLYSATSNTRHTTCRINIPFIMMPGPTPQEINGWHLFLFFFLVLSSRNYFFSFCFCFWTSWVFWLESTHSRWIWIVEESRSHATYIVIVSGIPRFSFWLLFLII